MKKTRNPGKRTPPPFCQGGRFVMLILVLVLFSLNMCSTFQLCIEHSAECLSVTLQDMTSIIDQILQLSHATGFSCSSKSLKKLLVGHV